MHLYSVVDISVKKSKGVTWDDWGGAFVESAINA